MGLRGWNSIKNILKYDEFQFMLDFSAHTDFDRIRLSDDGIKEFMYGVQHSTSLRQLNIRENNITHIGAEIIKEYIPKTKITDLNISNNPLGNTGIQHIAKLLNMHDFELTTLNISNCKFNQIGAFYIYKRLRRSEYIQSLILDDNPLKGPTIKYLCEALWNNKVIKSLSVARCELDLEANSYILDGVEKSVSIQYLNMAKNNINDDLGDALCYLLASKRSSLKYINLADNSLTEKQVENIQITPYMKTIVLRNNNIKSSGGRHMLNVVTNNKNLRRVDLTMNMVGVQYMMDIKNQIQKNKEDFY